MPMHGQVYAERQPVRLCLVCGKILAELLIDQGIEYHIGCDPKTVMEQRNATLKQEIIGVVEWVEEHSPRSSQVEIGPSEMGTPCEQRIARKMAGMPQVNFRGDPWPAIVGTAVHTWLERAVAIYQRDYPGGTPVRNWMTEVDSPIDDIIPSHSDLYTHEFDVVDYKNPGPSMWAKIIKGYISNEYRVQGHLYGFAHERAGRKVRDVVLAFFPRAGKLKDLYLHREPYDRRIAEAAIERVYSIGGKAIELQVLEHPERWSQIPTAPGEDCYNCEFFVDRPAEQLPDGTGCPGGNLPAAERIVKSKEKFAKGLL